MYGVPVGLTFMRGETEKIIQKTFVPPVGQLTKVDSTPAKGDSFSYMFSNTATPPSPKAPKTPKKTTSSNQSKVNNANQRAVIQIAKDANNRGGISIDNAKTLLQWAKEYGVNGRIDQAHTSRSGLFSQYMHLHINNMHIKIFP